VTETLKEEIKKLDGPIVVFGAGGFIGANLVHAILSVRSDCFAVTHQPFVPWRLIDVPSANVVQCDITQAVEVERLFARFGFRTLFCLAAYGAYSRQSDVDCIYRTNFQGFVNVVQVAEKKGFSALVHAGSSSEYGLNCSAPGEDASKRPNSHYSVSKVAASYFLQFQGEQRRLPVINLRLYSVYGPWEEADRFVPQIVEQGLEHKLPPLVDPDISRDFVYIDDAIEASILAATRGVKAQPGASVNVGTGRRTTIREVAETAREVFGIEAPLEFGSMPNRAWDLRDWYADPRLAEELLGWKARTGLKDGLAATRDWRLRHGPPPRIVPREAHPKLIRLSAIIACYRDAQAIPIMHERLSAVFRKLNVDYEILFVNDSSPDDTDRVLEDLCARDSRVIAIEHSRNFGSQNAFLSGMSVASGDAVILLDGDLQDPPELIADFYQEWMKGFEVVYGRRVRREASGMLQFCYKAFYRVFRRLAYIPIPVDAGDFSLMDRKVVDQLLKFPETDQFLRGLRAWVGFRQTGVDYIRPERLFGRSTNNWHKNFWWARKAIFNFSFVPMDVLLYGGIGLTLLSILGFAGQIVSKLLNPSIPHGVTTIIILIFFFGGLNMLGISILGEYLGKVFEESKRRPKYIRRSIRHGADHLTASEAMEEFVSSRTHALLTSE